MQGIKQKFLVRLLLSLWVFIGIMSHAPLASGYAYSGIQQKTVLFEHSNFEHFQKQKHYEKTSTRSYFSNKLVARPTRSKFLHEYKIKFNTHSSGVLLQDYPIVQTATKLLKSDQHRLQYYIISYLKSLIYPKHSYW